MRAVKIMDRFRVRAANGVQECTWGVQKMPMVRRGDQQGAKHPDVIWRRFQSPQQLLASLELGAGLDCLYKLLQQRRGLMQLQC